MQTLELQTELKLLNNDRASILRHMDKIQNQMVRIEKNNKSKSFLLSKFQKARLWFLEYCYESYKMDLCECDEEIQTVSKKIDGIA